MTDDPISLASPAFGLLIAIELWVARRQGRKLYRLNDSLNDLATGILQQMSVLLLAVVVIGAYVALYETGHWLDLTAQNPWTWLACYMAIDFIYYWFHRWSHEVNFLWAAHVVHHQSEEYNLTVALRQSVLQPLFSSIFYWPLAGIGFPPALFAVSLALNTLYQFWIHTRTIDKLGPLEWVLMTPSHHRVHHGRNPIYIDRNHGATFIFWDKLFGTYEPEGEEVHYGITTPLASWNPIWANAQYWVELWRSAARTRAWRDKLLVFLKPPGWFPDDLGGFQAPPEIEPNPQKFDIDYAPAIGRYAVLQLALVLVLLAALTFGQADLDRWLVWLWAALVSWGLVDIGGLFEGRGWAPRSERLRLIAIPLATLPAAAHGVGWLLPLLLALASLVSFRMAALTAASDRAHDGAKLEVDEPAPSP